MSNSISKVINERIYKNFHDIDYMPDFTEPDEVFQLLTLLSKSTMVKYAVMKFGDFYHVTNPVSDYPVYHQHLGVSLACACLASIGVSQDEVRDLIFEYNFDEGLL